VAMGSRRKVPVILGQDVALEENHDRRDYQMWTTNESRNVSVATSDMRDRLSFTTVPFLVL
jgi:hypothetical protein